MQESQIKEYVVRNFDKGIGQYQENSKERVWAKLDPEDIYILLKNCNGMHKHSAKILLKQMTKKKWTIVATAHEGGKDKNAPLHISIRVKNQIAYHLNCKEINGKGLHIYEITQKPINVD